MAPSPASVVRCSRVYCTGVGRSLPEQVGLEAASLKFPWLGDHESLLSRDSAGAEVGRFVSRMFGRHGGQPASF